MEPVLIRGSARKSAASPSKEVVLPLYCAAQEATSGALCLFFGCSVKKHIDILE